LGVPYRQIGDKTAWQNNGHAKDQEKDIFWWSPGAFVRDASPGDLLQIYGVPLTGGSNSVFGIESAGVPPAGRPGKAGLASGGARRPAGGPTRGGPQPCQMWRGRGKPPSGRGTGVGRCGGIACSREGRSEPHGVIASREGGLAGAADPVPPALCQTGVNLCECLHTKSSWKPQPK
jgi:hypothetical protein